VIPRAANAFFLLRAFGAGASRKPQVAGDVHV